jgi:hypothetical protein
VTSHSYAYSRAAQWAFVVVALVGVLMLVSALVLA